jgi:hypothetical protein
VTGNKVKVAVDNNRAIEAKDTNAFRQLSNLFLAVRSRILRIDF